LASGPTTTVSVEQRRELARRVLVFHDDGVGVDLAQPRRADVIDGKRRDLKFFALAQQSRDRFAEEPVAEQYEDVSVAHRRPPGA
jgi:hypothetical protein